MRFDKVTNVIENTWLGLQYKALSLQNKIQAEDALVLTGDPRGGTTWLAEVLKQLPGTALLWEPLAISYVPQFKDLGFSWRQYIPENESWPQAKEAFSRLFSGRLLNPYLCRTTSPTEIKNARRLFIKFCRANQLLPWLTRQFKFNYAPIYLVRHPCAVVASQLKHGGWNQVTPEFEIPDGRYASFYSNHQSFLATMDTVEKKMAATWCLCNKVPLTHSDNNICWITLTYESLLQNPCNELDRIASRWKITLPENVYKRASNTSATTRKGSPIQQGKIEDQLSYWKRQLNTKQIDDILSVLQYFEIDLYDSHELPHQRFVG